jgi:hypothetical protein
LGLDGATDVVFRRIALKTPTSIQSQFSRPLKHGEEICSGSAQQLTAAQDSAALLAISAAVGQGRRRRFLLYAFSDARVVAEVETMARLLSVHVGLPRDIPWQGKTVHTGIWKTPAPGPRMVRRLNIDGDGQGDLNGHGGEHRAVLVYQIDSYRYWQA